MGHVCAGLIWFLHISLLLLAENATSVTPTPAEVSAHRGTKAPSREMPQLWTHKHRAAPYYHTAKLQQFQTSISFLHPCKGDILLKFFETTVSPFFSVLQKTRALFPSWKSHLRAHGPPPIRALTSACHGKVLAVVLVVFLFPSDFLFKGITSHHCNMSVLTPKLH